MKFVCLLAWAFAALTMAAQQSGPTEMQKAVEEFRLQTRSLGLRADSPQGGPKAKRPAWHGRLFENFRNDFLDAVPHEITQRGGSKSLLRRNQFGFNVAGPVFIPRIYDGGRKTYFSLSYEGVRERISRSYLRTIPTVAERAGDWSETVDQAGTPLPVYDPRSTRPNPGYDASRPVAEDNLQYLRDPFPNDRIPAARLDPVALKALELYPLPNTNVGPFFRNNYFYVSPETNAANGMIAKLEHNPGERHRVSFGLQFSNGSAAAAKIIPTDADPGPSDRTFSSRRGSMEHVLTLSPRTVNTAGFDASTDSSENSGNAFPIYRFSPYLSMGRGSPVSRSARNTYVWSDSFSTRRGKHNLRASGQLVRYQINSYLPGSPAGNYNFSSGITSLPGIVNTGHAFAGFLLGLSDYAEVSLVDSPSYFRRSSGQVAFRESWEAAKGLTLHAGANLDISTPRVEKYDRQSTVDLRTINPVNNRAGALIVAGRNGVGRAFQPVNVRLEPNASLSWSPRGNPKTVLRLAYSRSYSQIPIYSTQWGTQGFTGTPTYISPNIQLEPAVVLSRGLPPPENPLPDLRPEAANDTVADLFDRTSRQPRYQSASFSLERELPGQVVLSAGGYHADGRNLLVSGNVAGVNAIRPEALSFRDGLNEEAFNRSLRPYPQYKGFDVYWAWPLGRYARDAAWTRLEKRTSRGLSLSAYYEFAKQMDDYSGPYGTQDFFDRSKEWSLTAGFVPHRVSLTYSYELPLGPNKVLLAYSDWRRVLVEGWSISGVSSVSSGEPIALRPQFNNTGGVITTLNVNVVPGVDPHAPQRSPDMWFNAAAFDQPADFTMGNASRTHPSLRNPSSQNHDLSLTKRFALTADRTLEFSAVGLNFLNHANWTDPDTTIGPASAPNVNAGKIIGSRGGRVVQLGMRFSF